MNNERKIIETGVRMFLKELQKLDFFHNYVAEKLLQGDENLDNIISQLTTEVYYLQLRRETTEQVANELLLNFDQIEISFMWDESTKGYTYWNNAWHLFRRKADYAKAKNN